MSMTKNVLSNGRTNMRMQGGMVCLLFSTFVMWGQRTQSTISGSVTDPDGAEIANAQVRAKNQTGAQFEAKTSSSGGYTLTDLPAGTYQIVINSPGLQPFAKSNVVVPRGEAVRFDARLEDFPSLGAVGEDRVFYANIFGAHDAPSGPTPRTPDGQPDFSGVWHTLRVVDPGNPAPLPWAEEVIQQRLANNRKDAPSSRCLPYGITLEGLFLGFRIMQNPTVMAFLYEEDLPRQIYLDGRKHPDESLSPFVGHSVGKWEGDTLVVDTVGFNDKTWLDLQGRPHTDQMHVIEHFWRKDLGHLEVEILINDPGAYKKPWTMKRVSELASAGEEVGQYVCTENNRDVPHLVGK